MSEFELFRWSCSEESHTELCVHFLLRLNDNSWMVIRGDDRWWVVDSQYGYVRCALNNDPEWIRVA